VTRSSRPVDDGGYSSAETDMTKLGITSVSILLAAGSVVSLAIHQRAQAGLSERRESLRRQTAELAQLAADNERLSNLVAAMDNDSSPELLSQLLRLRSEVGQLRKVGPQKAQLQAANNQLRARETKAQSKLAAAQASPNYWARDQLGFAGYSDPESAVKSLLWMMQTGNMTSWQAACTPEAVSQLERQWAKRGLSEAARGEELKQMADALMSRSSGFHVLDQKTTAPDEAVINLSFDGEDKARKFVLRKIGNDWKFHDLILSGQGGAN
jgi:hypothetical protein